MRVIVGCEFSQVVCKAFRDKGHEAYSCDLKPCLINPAWHYQCDLFTVIDYEFFDLGIFHPECKRLTVAGARWFKGHESEQMAAILFAERCWRPRSNIPKIVVENPIGVLSTKSTLGKPTQIVQPWMFGHGEVKATCLWMRGVSLLKPTRIVSGPDAACSLRVTRNHQWIDPFGTAVDNLAGYS